MAVTIDVLDDRRTFLFDDGEQRTLMNDYAHLMVRAELEEDAAAEARRYFAKHAAKASPTAPKKKKAASKAKAPKRKAKAAAAEPAAKGS